MSLIRVEKEAVLIGVALVIIILTYPVSSVILLPLEIALRTPVVFLVLWGYIISYPIRERRRIKKILKYGWVVDGV